LRKPSMHAKLEGKPMAEHEPKSQESGPTIDEIRRAVDAASVAKLARKVNESIQEFQEEHRVSQGALDLEISV
jgi:hypothetical protein